MKLSLLKNIIDALEDIADYDDIEVCINDGRDGIESYVKAEAKFTINKDKDVILSIFRG